MKHGRLLLITGLLLAIVTFFLVFKATQPPPPEIIPEVRVLVVEDGLMDVYDPSGEKSIGVIPAGTPFYRALETEGVLGFKTIPAEYVTPYTIIVPDDVTTPAELIKDYGLYYTEVDLQTGNVIEKTVLTTTGGLPQGMRAVGLAVNQMTSVGGTVRPGNRVDVVVSYVLWDDEGNSQAYTEMLFENVLVLSIFGKQRFVLFPDPVSGKPQYSDVDLSQEFTPEGKPVNDTVVNLALTPRDALKLAYMANFAEEVRLLIRPIGDPGEIIQPDVFHLGGIMQPGDAVTRPGIEP